MSARGERGVALLTALILVAIAAVVAAAVGASSGLSARRTSTLLGAEQSLLAAEGAEALAGWVRKQTNNAPTRIDSPDEEWAMPYGPVQLAPDVTLEFTQLEDLQGRFNLNNLAPGGNADPNAVKIFQNLLGILGLETKWAQLTADWIDRDQMPLSPDGAEDSVYLAQTPPYRAANIPISSISELLALPGFGRARYERLAPYIAALPTAGAATKINVCTASGVVLDALTGKTEYSTDTQLATKRQKGCFPQTTVFLQSVNTDQEQYVQSLISSNSSYFRLRSFITIGNARTTVYSLLYQDDGGQVHTIIRTFGTE